jgi:hypothetical protein
MQAGRNTKRYISSPVPGDADAGEDDALVPAARPAFDDDIMILEMIALFIFLYDICSDVIFYAAVLGMEDLELSYDRERERTDSGFGWASLRLRSLRNLNIVWLLIEMILLPVQVFLVLRRRRFGKLLESEMFDAEIKKDAEYQFQTLFRRLISSLEWTVLLAVDAPQAFCLFLVYKLSNGTMPQVGWHLLVAQGAKAFCYALKSHLHTRHRGGSWRSFGLLVAHPLLVCYHCVFFSLSQSLYRPPLFSVLTVYNFHCLAIFTVGMTLVDMTVPLDWSDPELREMLSSGATGGVFLCFSSVAGVLTGLVDQEELLRHVGGAALVCTGYGMILAFTQTLPQVIVVTAHVLQCGVRDEMTICSMPRSQFQYAQITISDFFCTPSSSFVQQYTYMSVGSKLSVGSQLSAPRRARHRARLVEHG